MDLVVSEAVLLCGATLLCSLSVVLLYSSYRFIYTIESQHEKGNHRRSFMSFRWRSLEALAISQRCGSAMVHSLRRKMIPGSPCTYVGSAPTPTVDEDFERNAKFLDVTPEQIRASADPPSSSAASVEEIEDLSLLSPKDRYEGRQPSTLTVQERRQLVDMIYKAHYRSEATDGSEGVKAMLYQAALEVKFIEDHIETLAAKQQNTDKHMTRDDVRRLIKRSVIERSDLHKPLSYVIGYQPFYGCNITCSAPLLCPRPETEMWTHWLVSNFLKFAQDPVKVLDMCSGTGCIGIAIAKNAPTSSVLALDILSEAVAASNANAKKNRIPEGRYQCVQSDMFSYLDDNKIPEKSLDVLVSNPPYVLPQQYEELPPTITHWESKIALVGDPSREHRQYLYFQELCERGAYYLKPAEEREAALQRTPSIVIEIGLQGEKVASIMEKHPAWMDVDLHTDFAGQPRWVSARRK